MLLFSLFFGWRTPRSFLLSFFLSFSVYQYSLFFFCASPCFFIALLSSFFRWFLSWRFYVPRYQYCRAFIALTDKIDIVIFPKFSYKDYFSNLMTLLSLYNYINFSIRLIHFAAFLLESVWPDWAIYWTLDNFLKPMAAINLSKSPTFLGNFCKGVKIYHCSSEIIFGQLL